MSGKRVHVAVGVIIDQDRRILIAKRHDHLHQGGLWEFPGGKVEQDEHVFQALCRELHEELDIEPVAGAPLLEVEHDYGDKTVLLDVWWVTDFEGTPMGKEGQPIAWVAAPSLKDYDFPEANARIVERVIAELSAGENV